MEKTATGLDERWTEHHHIPVPAEEWVRGPLDWRETYDLLAGQQVHGVTQPGAVLDNNPRAVQIMLPGNGFRAMREYSDAVGERRWTWRSIVFQPIGIQLMGCRHFQATRETGGQPIGDVIETRTRIELRRNDPWRTLLAYLHRNQGRPSLDEEDDTARVLRAAAIVFSLHWPAGPPRLRT